jgi:DNA-binding NarL/FixJ family response regulator
MPCEAYFCVAFLLKVVPINLLLVDDHAIVTDGIKALLEGDASCVIKGEAANGQDAIEMLRALKVDIVLLDVDMPVLNGIDTLSRIKKDFSHVKVIMLTMHEERAMVNLLLEMGADGYLLKNSSKNELKTCINKVANNEAYLSPEVNAILLQEDEPKPLNPQLAQLTEREVEIIRLIAEGMSNKEIGERLFISHRTVDTHRTNVMTKLNVHNVAGIVRFAIKNGLAQ